MRYWKRINARGETTTVESYSHELDIAGAVEIDEAEFINYLASLPPPVPIVTRDLAKEIDDLKSELRIKGVI